MRTLAGRYELRDSLRAGENLVYRAWDNRTHQEVAVKRLRAGSNTRELDQFPLESRELTGLAHPNRIEVLDLGTFEREGEQRP